jgi:hypothetical protein
MPKPRSRNRHGRVSTGILPVALVSPDPPRAAYRWRGADPDRDAEVAAALARARALAASSVEPDHQGNKELGGDAGEREHDGDLS